jgi:hypothetical protein
MSSGWVGRTGLAKGLIPACSDGNWTDGYWVFVGSCRGGTFQIEVGVRIRGVTVMFVIDGPGPSV